MKFAYIDAGADGHVVAVKESGCPFYREGITNKNPKGDSWKDIGNYAGKNAVN